MVALAAHMFSSTVLVLALALGAAPSGAVWPLDPRPEVVHGFDPPPTPYSAGHRGVDLLGRPGQEVRAISGGTVSYAGLLAGRGVVVVDHGDTRTTYEPVRASVAVGDRVGAGSAIGTLGWVSGHCAPRTCLHLGLLRGETYLDPLTLLGPGPVRLLPLLSPPVARVEAPARPWWLGGRAAWLRRAGAPAGRPGATGPW